MPELLHYAAAPVTLQPRTYEQMAHFKPNGFWVSVEDAWKDWCNGESWGQDRLLAAHRVELVDHAKLLHLATVEEIDRFTAQYGVMLIDGGSMHAIDWPRVAAEWQGILIAPYQWSRRMTFATSWYYPWDCASGCIWDVAAIKSVALLPFTPVEVTCEVE